MTADNTILLVEDNSYLALLYTHYLTDAYEVRTAKAGEEAIRKATPAVDLIILDYLLPDMLGTDVHQQIRGNGSQAPAIIMSGTDPEFCPEQNDVARWLTKPLYKDELQTAVRDELSASKTS